MMKCQICGQTPMRIDLTLTADRRATMSWCAGCDTRTWESEGEAVEVGDVLGALPRGLKARKGKAVIAPAETTMSGSHDEDMDLDLTTEDTATPRRKG